VQVPSHWVLDPDRRYGPPIYTNVNMPIPFDPPYARTPTRPVTFGSPSTPRRRKTKLGVLLRFDGVESFAVVSLNGVEVGILRGSRLPTELVVRPRHDKVTQWRTTVHNALSEGHHRRAAGSFNSSLAHNDV